MVGITGSHPIASSEILLLVVRHGSVDTHQETWLLAVTYTVKLRDTTNQSRPKRTVTENGFPSSVWIGAVARGQQSTDSIIAGPSPERV
jgi:hypothetical protein